MWQAGEALKAVEGVAPSFNTECGEEHVQVLTHRSLVDFFQELGGDGLLPKLHAWDTFQSNTYGGHWSSMHRWSSTTALEVHVACIQQAFTCDAMHNQDLVKVS